MDRGKENILLHIPRKNKRVIHVGIKGAKVPTRKERRNERVAPKLVLS